MHRSLEDERPRGEEGLRVDLCSTGHVSDKAILDAPAQFSFRGHQTPLSYEGNQMRDPK